MKKTHTHTRTRTLLGILFHPTGARWVSFLGSPQIALPASVRMYVCVCARSCVCVCPWSEWCSECIIPVERLAPLLPAPTHTHTLSQKPDRTQHKPYAQLALTHPYQSREGFVRWSTHLLSESFSIFLIQLQFKCNRCVAGKGKFILVAEYGSAR